MVLGGIIGASAPEPAIIEAMNPLSYPSLLSSGTVRVLIALIVAAPDPEIPAKIILANTETIPIPPRIWATQARQKSRIRVERLAAPIISPARIKSGPAISEKEFMPRMACCTAIKAGISLPNMIAKSPERPIAKHTGTPSTRKISRVISAMAIIYLSPSLYCLASLGMALA